jgi:FHA domain
MMIAGFTVCDVHATRGAFAIAGSGPTCDLRLDQDPTIGPCHLFVQSEELDDGGVRLRVLDIDSPHGFGLADGSATRSIATTGPLVLSLGAYVIVALPNQASHAPTLPKVAGACASDDRIHARTLVVETPMAELPGSYEMIFTSPQGRAVVRATAADLDRGVLVGRPPLAKSRGLDAILNVSISRTHLLLLRGASGCVANDLGTTNGTFHRGRRIRALVLEDEGVELILGTTKGVRMRWRACR